MNFGSRSFDVMSYSLALLKFQPRTNAEETRNSLCLFSARDEMTAELFAAFGDEFFDEARISSERSSLHFICIMFVSAKFLRHLKTCRLSWSGLRT